MDIESDSSHTNLVIISKKDRAIIFWKIYWKTITTVIAPLILLPLAFIGENNAYTSFYILLLTSLYWISDVMHPVTVSLVPIALSTLIGSRSDDFFGLIFIKNGVVDGLGIMMLIVAMEYSQIQRRVALKLLLIFGCSHYRLSFLLFFFTTFLSMWISNSMACGLMIPLVKAVLLELEKLGILEIYQTIGKATQKSNRHEQNLPRPTDFTVFYFLGIAYSSSIGGMSTILGSQTNQIFKQNCEKIFPLGPKIEFPHFMLLNLPAVLLMETLLYLWLNFYFMGMFRAQSQLALEVGISEDEVQYIHTSLSIQYRQIGKPRFQEYVVGAVIILIIILQTMAEKVQSHIHVSSPTIVGVVLLFIIPVNLDFLKFIKKFPVASDEPLPTSPTKACLNWNLVRLNIPWSVLFVIGGCCMQFDSLKSSRMTEEFEGFLLLFRRWPAPALALVVILFCKLLAEVGGGSCVADCMLPHIARLSVIANVHPLYLMMAATLSCSLPFHLITGAPANAMVAAYLHIPLWKIMRVGVGPSVTAVVVVWFTVTLWSKVIWPDVNVYPAWADRHTFHNDTSL